MPKLKVIVCFGALSFPLGGLLAAESGGAPESERVFKLLSDAKTMTFQLKEDAVVMESFTRMKVSVETQAAAIDKITEDINALRRQETKLQDAKTEASPWQKNAIERITPFLDELEGYTLAIVEHLKGAPKHNFAEYDDYLEANADYATDLAAMIADYVEYGKTKERLERLAGKLEIPLAR
ncbi:MAG TPA: hypothetical protein VH639_16320 [Bryobacteraceae bacterium]|jgi:hypothetical protein